MTIEILKEVSRDSQSHVTVLCKCVCGKKFTTRVDSIKSGKTQSCGCHHIGQTKKSNTTHGDTTDYGMSKEYNTWRGMKYRCSNENAHEYKNYGGRGISVCTEWSDSFQQFLDDMGRKPSDQHWIERIDNNGNYEPSNCVWATPKQQMNNQRPRSL